MIPPNIHLSKKPFTVVVALASLAGASVPKILARDSCAQNYVACSPKGATSESIPSVGNQLVGLYTGVLNSINAKSSKRDEGQIEDVLEARDNVRPVCCAEATQCLLLQTYNVPFCWDKFTTNFFLPDGSYGTISSGNYSAADGTQANLITGDYKLTNGQMGNIYTGDEGAKPDTVTLPMPTPFTSKGVGSAIPASALGGAATYTTVISGSVGGGTVIPAQTFTASVVNGSTVAPQSTIAATTIPGTTFPAETSVVTKTGASATKTGTAGSIVSQPGIGMIAGLLLTTFAVFGL